MKISFLLFLIASTLIVHGQPTIRIPEIAVPKLKTIDTRLKAETTIFKAQNSNPFALVAGGSKGIGFAIAEALALRRYNLILIARHHGPLMEAKKTLETKYNVQVEIMSYDLSQQASAPAIAGWCIENKIPLKMLCNVAGMAAQMITSKFPWIHFITWWI